MNPITTYDFTLFSERPVEEVRSALKQSCRQWVFQKEKCPTTGREHYQGRVHVRRKMRLTQLLGEFETTPLAGAHWSPTSNATMGDVFYVTKAESRIDGPWSDKDALQRPIPRQIAEITTLRPWQQRIVDLSKAYDPRTIYYVLDEEGGVGKSTLMCYMTFHKLAQRIPPTMKNAEDLMACVLDTREVVEQAGHNCYVVDIPRAMDLNALKTLWIALEELKNGFAYDKRYRYREVQFTCPQIFVFTNTLPPQHVYTRDRWQQIEVLGVASAPGILPEPQEDFSVLPKSPEDPWLTQEYFGEFPENEY